MALETSGTLSIGGTTTNRSINLELGRSATATSSLGETDLRDLAGVASGAIGIDDFYGASSVFNIENSLKFEADNTEIIYRTNDSGTNRKTFTVSLWFKRTELGATQEVWHGGRNGELVGIGIITYSGFADQLWIDVGGGTGNTGTLYRSASTQKIRDTSAWYHVCLAVDTTQGTEANRMKVWLNGEEVTDWAQHQIPAQDFQCALESITEMAWGGFRPSNVDLFSGYLAECHYLDGVTAVQTDFGEYDDSGIWKPKAYAGSYGGNGCYLKFDNAASLGADSSGNGNNFTLNNIEAADQATDTPTNNFATWNILNRYFSTTINEGATKVTNSDVANWRSYVSTIAVSSGKWYAEFEAGGTSFIGVGDVAEITGTKSYTQYLGQIPASIGYYSVGLLFYSGASQSGSFAGFGDGDVISCALDKDNGFVYWAKNGVWQNSGVPTSGATGTGGVALTSGNSGYAASDQYIIGYSPLVANSPGFANYGGFTASTISSAATDANGYGTFEYAPPSGYYALCTKNLAEYG